MNSEDLNLIAQTIESMISISGELEQALEKGKSEKITETKKEILKFQKQIDVKLAQWR